MFERTDDEIVKKTRVLQVLRALPGNPAKVTALMTASGVDENRRVGGLARRAACEAARGRLAVSCGQPRT